MKLAAIAASLLFLVSSSFPQPNLTESRIEISAKGGKISVSGVVRQAAVKIEVEYLLRRVLSPDVLTGGLIVDPNARDFIYGWQGDLTSAVRDAKRWRAGTFSFETDWNKLEETVLEALHKTEVRLFNTGRKANVVDEKKDATFVYLFATWAGPTRNQIPELNSLYRDFGQKGLDIVALNADDEPENEIKAFAAALRMNHRIASAPAELIDNLMRLSSFRGIPLGILIHNGKIKGIYKGAAKEVTLQIRKHIETIFN